MEVLTPRCTLDPAWQVEVVNGGPCAFLDCKQADNIGPLLTLGDFCLVYLQPPGQGPLNSHYSAAFNQVNSLSCKTSVPCSAAVDLSLHFEGSGSCLDLY